MVYLGAGMRHTEIYLRKLAIHMHGVLLWGIKKQNPNTDSECIFAKFAGELPDSQDQIYSLIQNNMFFFLSFQDICGGEF